jgi:hypothetical protein
MRKCSRCGTENRDEDNYCTDCGWTLHSQWKPASEAKGNKKKASPAARVFAGLAALILFGWLYSLLTTGSITGTSSLPAAGNPNVAVVYEVTGNTRSVSVTLSNAGGNTEQYSHYRVPFRLSYQMKHGEFAYLSAQNDEESGDITATIYTDGTVFKTSSSHGAYVIASASGLVP